MPAPSRADTPGRIVQDWASSGAMWLTGRAGGPPLLCPGRPASMVRDELERLSAQLQSLTGTHPALPGVSILGERAAVAKLGRRGPWSCGGSFRTLPARDGWIGLSLARESDIALVPALIESDDVDDPWAAVSSWATGLPSAALASRLELLGLPGSAIPLEPPANPDRLAVVSTVGGRRRHRRDRPMVIDLTSLWAGPLCAHLLGLGGADVVKVESTSRPDGARRGPRGFFDLLHAGHRSVAVDFADVTDLQVLRDLMLTADLVLESSRPRALLQLGIRAEDYVTEGVCWLSITAAGRASSRVGFGDDVAAGAGLFVLDQGEVLPVGDAVADPLTGVVAARAAADALLDERASLVDVSMHHACLEAARNRTVPPATIERDATGAWHVTTDEGSVVVQPPNARRPAAPAATMGAHTTDVLGR